MTWAFKRQIIYLSVLIVFIVAVGSAIIYPRINQAPTCSDNKKNGTETGVDCGGSCALACISQVDDISVLWARAFRVVPGRYNAVAYLQNQNNNIAVNKINYRFRFADANNVYIGKREGSTFVPPSGKFAVFEPGIDIGNSIPVYVTFEFTETPQWIKISPEKVSQLQVLVSDIKLVNEDTSPVLSATIKNNSFFIIPEVHVVAILYDSLGNAVSASSTFLDSLAAEEQRNLIFTWPEPLPGAIIAKEIIPLYNIFLVKLK